MSADNGDFALRIVTLINDSANNLKSQFNTQFDLLGKEIDTLRKQVDKNNDALNKLIAEKIEVHRKDFENQLANEVEKIEKRVAEEYGKPTKINNLKLRIIVGVSIAIGIGFGMIISTGSIDAVWLADFIKTLLP